MPNNTKIQTNDYLFKIFFLNLLDAKIFKTSLNESFFYILSHFKLI